MCTGSITSGALDVSMLVRSRSGITLRSESEVSVSVAGHCDAQVTTCDNANVGDDRPFQKDARAMRYLSGEFNLQGAWSDRSLCQKATDVISHRGPDDGVVLARGTDEGMRRPRHYR